MLQDTRATRVGGTNTRQLAQRIRTHVLEMTNRAGSSHIGSIFSMVDIVSVLYGRVLKVDPQQPQWPGRDRFILSKGHAGAGVYAALAETGFFGIEKLSTYYKDGSVLSGHVSHKNVPGIELSTGSLGHGLSVGTGMAYSALLTGKKHRVYVLLSDGECDEGSNWEAILFAAHNKLNNLYVVVDYNKIQSLATVSETMALEPFTDKWQSFGWDVREVDGHNHDQLASVLSASATASKPTCVIAHTTKGKGVSFMEDSVLWHYRTARGQEFDSAMVELNEEAA